MGLGLGCRLGPSGSVRALQTQAAEPAPFGRNQELVLDPSYRNALQIKADGGFALSAGLPTPEMLGDIAALMQPAAPQVFAQLHKLNIYGPGGMFKEHVDTPVSQEHFGSLVVALPATFEGGQLVVRHDGRAATLTLGGGAVTGHATKATEPTPLVSPVAEAGHPKTSNAADLELDSESGNSDGNDSDSSNNSGNSGSSDGTSGGSTGGSGTGEGGDLKAALGPRKTADKAASRGTRRLLSTVRPLAGGSIPLVAKLRELMAQPTWQPGGATLGYVLEHKYASTFDELTKMLWEPKAEGDDADDLLERVYMGRGFTNDKKRLGWVSVYDMSMRDALEESGFQPATSRDILWLGLSGKGAEAKFPVQTAVSAYGNEPTTAMVYSGVAMLLQVPAWGTPQRNAAMAPGEHAHAQAQEQTPGAGPVPAQVEERHDLQ
ncbi:hypothetical protein GPECTOR_78g70 [Gonium pectorale]|uniref:Uncharacterized protein n=1 Tax=Gonium pectorale TaxID=33097 RepID=A0A150G1Y5_GONPE|nr:hypothetical protein GPECTOR_78g70 [Gonium pectorale]|eukprot:KXZ43882.1 hypothetical protein GPECTOR_78g70 [Gonium pectorale]